MNIVNQDTKQYVTIARDFLLDLIAQRRRARVAGERKVHRSASLQACGIIEAQLTNYQYTNKTLAQFIIAHFNTIQLLVPGTGSENNSKYTIELMKIYNQALIINTDPLKKRYSYYLVANDFGESYVKNSSADCTIAKLGYDGRAEFIQYETSFKKYPGDTPVEITQRDYEDGVRKVLAQLRKDLDV